MTPLQHQPDPNVGSTPSSVQRVTVGLVGLRLSQQFGESPRSWEDRINNGERSWFVGCARIIHELRACGLADLIPEKVRPIEQALASQVIPPLFDAISAEQLADGIEDVSQEPFRENLRTGVATITEAENYLKRSAAARHRAEVCEIAVARWVAERKEAACLEAERQRRREAQR